MNTWKHLPTIGCQVALISQNTNHVLPQMSSRAACEGRYVTCHSKMTCFVLVKQVTLDSRVWSEVKGTEHLESL